MAKLIEMNIKTSSGYEILYPVTVGMMQPQIIITTNPNVSVTASKDGKNINKQADSSGKCVLEVDDYGTWNIVASFQGINSNNLQVNIDAVKQYSEELFVPLFGNLSWNNINSYLSDGNINMFNIGDYHSIVLNGTAGDITFNNVQAYAIVIGKNHNSSVEGNNKLHLQIALNTANTQLLQDAQMNTTATNAGGWNGCYMRNTICSQFLNCLPSDLRDIVKDTIKYTDNYGNNGGNNQSHVTSTTDKVFLLSEYEIFGACTYSNTYEANYQQQYEWYQGLDDNGRIKYQYNAPTSAHYYWERSPYRSGATNFCTVHSIGTALNDGAGYSDGFAPCLCI